MSNPIPKESPNSNANKWGNVNNCELNIIYRKIDWSKTKYYQRNETFNNVPPNHFAVDLIPDIISKEIPGILANHVCDYAKNAFNPNLDYSSKDIYEMCGGLFWGVTYRTDDTIEVTYVSYDHHNEPVYTEKYTLISKKN